MFTLIKIAGLIYLPTSHVLQSLNFFLNHYFNQIVQYWLSTHPKRLIADNNKYSDLSAQTVKDLEGQKVKITKILDKYKEKEYEIQYYEKQVNDLEQKIERLEEWVKDINKHFADIIMCVKNIERNAKPGELEKRL